MLPLDGQRGPVNALALSRDGKMLATAGADKKMRLWDLAAGVQVHNLQQPSDDPPAETIGLGFSPDGSKLAARQANMFHSLILWDAKSGKVLRHSVATIIGSDNRRGAVAFAPDGMRVAAQFGRSVILKDAAGKVVFRLQLAGESAELSLAFAPDGKALAIGDSSGAVTLVDASTGRIFSVWKDTRPVRALTFLPGGTKLAVADGSRAVRLLDVAGGKGGKAFESPDAIDALALDPEGKWAATAGASGTVRIWDVAAGKNERHFQAMGPVKALSLGLSAKLVVTAGAEGVVVWDLTRDEKPLPKDLTLTDKELDNLWSDLASDEVGKAYAASRLLRADPARAVPFLRQQLKSKVPVPTPEKLQQLIADLDAQEFKKRAVATQELEKLGVLAESALRAALAKQPSLETKQRIERLLNLLALRGNSWAM
jgi:WD40 repeat protein